MNIVFMGSPDFAIPSMEKIHAHPDLKLSAVVSNVDKRRGRGTDKMPTPVKKRALELQLPVIEVENLKDENFEKKLRELNADLFVVVAFRVLPKSILEIPNIGSVNLHASLLPRYRGAAPIHWAVINGESETGCTIFFLDEQVDTGNILLQKKMRIGSDETTGEVYNRLMEEGSDALIEALQLIRQGNYELQPQDDSLATPAPKLFRENTELHFDKPASEVHNLIRGLSPFPTAWTTWKGEKMKIYRSALGPMANIDPGELLLRDDRLLVGCSDSTVEILELQLPGKKRISAADFIRGYEVSGYLSRD